ncbi:MAG: glycosyltransferase family 2 protein [Acidobacteriaceae bacterium]|nr:glycosyltransferase family 2 protein [Acidobacteriaceae bacterium]
MARVSAVIPTWNRADLLESILMNLRAQTRPPDQIVVIDNGSKDGSDAIAVAFGAELVRFPENRGFATAVNEGIRRADSDWVLILNNDVVLPPRWLEKLLRAAEETQAWFAVGKLLKPGSDGRLDGSWDLICRGGHAWRCGYGREQSWPGWGVRRRVAFAPMTAALFRREVFDRVGLLDTRFEAYYEDVDFGLRCALTDLDGVYEPEATATHMSKSTLGRQSARVLYLTARNQIFILAKHYPAAALRRFAWPIAAAQVLSLLGALRQGHFLAACRGIWDGLRQWNMLRRESQPHEKIEQILRKSEDEIRALQRQQNGFDPYWRLYFGLVRSG